MNSFFLITNHSKDPGLTFTKSVADYLCMHGAKAVIRKPQEAESRQHTDPSEVPDGTDCVIVLGGDGTMIRAAGDLVNCQLIQYMNQSHRIISK